MQLEPHDVEQFFRLHRTLMFFVNRRLKVLPDNFATPEDFAAVSLQARLRVRDALLANVDLIETFVTENPAGLPADELDIVRSWRHLVTGRFYVFRELAKYTVFLSASEPVTAYGVLALSQPLEEVIGPHLPILVQTVLLPFKGRIVYEGLLNSFNVSFGPGIRRSLNENFKEAKQRQGVVSSLPAPDKPAGVPKAKTRPKAQPPKAQTADAVREIASQVDAFCREHLNAEYAELCGRLVERLARKRPSPLVSGKPNTWACGIVRTVGWVNYLDDRSQKPHMKLTAIDKAFGVGESTGQGKSSLIRKLLKIRTLDPAWTLPSRMDRNPMAWIIQVNGFPLDARYVRREIQEEVFRKGLIPFIPERPQPADEEEE